jgi:hypothetical protein
VAKIYGNKWATAKVIKVHETKNGEDLYDIEFLDDESDAKGGGDEGGDDDDDAKGGDDDDDDDAKVVAWRDADGKNADR